MSTENNFELNPDCIPLEMRSQNSWVVWRSENRNGSKPTKVPYQPSSPASHASSNNSMTWADFSAACNAAKTGFSGIGFMAGEKPSGNILIDLDHCRHNGVIEDRAMEIVSIADSYTEISPSEEGLHIFAGGILPSGGIKTPSAEIYDNRRYFTVTGKVLDNRTKFRQLPPETVKRIIELIQATKKNKQGEIINGIEDELLAKMFKSKKGNAIRKLFNGDISSHGNDHSAADLALCAHLSYWTNNDATKMDSIFRQSKLMRDKWDQRHKSDGTTYGQMTIAKALQKHSSVSKIKKSDKQNIQEEDKCLLLSDSWNAEFLINNFGENIRFDHTRGKWLFWDGTRWKMDELGKILRFAKLSARKMHKLSDSYPEDSENRKRLRQHMLKSEQRKGLVDCIELAKHAKEIAKITKDFDDDPLLFNVQNGTIDLRTCTLREHWKDNYLSKISNVNFDACAEAPQWISFLNLIFDGSADLIAFVQRLIGLCLTGQIDEEILIFFYGTGLNGKTTFLESIRMLFGDYFIRAPASMLMAYKNQGIPNDIARLPGARLVVCSEIEDDNRLNESLVKDLTGGDTITARFLHREFFEFKPTHKLLIYGNHKPVVHGTDRGIWRRVLLIPFTVEIPEALRRPKPEVLARFEKELSGILNWALSGLKDYQKNGLQISLVVRQATAQYQSESDIVGSFIEEKCETSKEYTSTVASLYLTFLKWAEDNGESKMSHKKFSSKLKERGFENLKINGAYCWRGIRLYAQVN